MIQQEQKNWKTVKKRCAIKWNKVWKKGGVRVDSSKDIGEFAERLALAFLLGSKAQNIAPLTDDVIEAFPTTEYEDVFHKHDIVAIFEGSTEAGDSPLYPLALDITASALSVGTKVADLLQGEDIGDKTTRRFPPAPEKRFIFLPERCADAETYDFAGGMNRKDPIAARAFQVPMVGYIDIESFKNRSTVDISIVNDLRDLMNIQLLAQARLLASHALRMLNPAFPLYGANRTFSDLLEEADRLILERGRDLTENDAWLLRSVVAYQQMFKALEGGLRASSPRLGAWCDLLESNPQEAVMEEPFQNCVSSNFPDARLDRMNSHTYRLIQGVYERVGTENRPVAQRTKSARTYHAPGMGI